MPLLIHSANSPLAVAWGLELGRLFFSFAVYLPEKRGKESEHKISPRAGGARHVIGSLCQLQGAARRPSCGEHGDRGTRLLTHVNVPARSWQLGFHAASNEFSSTTDGEKGGVTAEDPRRENKIQLASENVGDLYPAVPDANGEHVRMRTAGSSRAVLLQKHVFPSSSHEHFLELVRGPAQPGPCGCRFRRRRRDRDPPVCSGRACCRHPHFASPAPAFWGATAGVSEPLRHPLDVLGQPGAGRAGSSHSRAFQRKGRKMSRR